MIRIIDTDLKDSYFKDKFGTKYLKYQPELTFVMKLDDGSILEVESSNIGIGYGGQLSFTFKDDTIIINDGWQDCLITTGYIILNNYDKEKIEDRDEGVELRTHLLKEIKNVLKDNGFEFKYSVDQFKITTSNQNILVSFSANGYEYKVSIDSINSIVNKNQQRKLNNLPFYPFQKNMDKYATFYVSVFCKRIEEDAVNSAKGSKSHDFIKDLIMSLNNLATEEQFRFNKIMVKKYLNYCEGI